MRLKQNTLEELKKIVEKDYGVILSDSEVAELGLSLLRLARLASVALARAEEKISSVQSIETIS